jgi:hypothetical protein
MNMYMKFAYAFVCEIPFDIDEADDLEYFCMFEVCLFGYVEHQSNKFNMLAHYIAAVAIRHRIQS